MPNTEASNKPTDLLRTEEVSKMLADTPVATLRYWRQQGVGPKSAKFGKHVLYRRADVEAWIAEQFGE